MKAVTWASTSRRHGTQSGWNLHQQLNEKPCDACYAAKAKYDKRRLDVPIHALKNRLHATAQGRATAQLRNMHPDDWKRLYADANAQLLIERADEIAEAKSKATTS